MTDVTPVFRHLLRRPVIAIGVGCLSAILIAPLALPAHADSPERRRRRVERKIDAQQDDVHESTVAVRRAAAALRKIAVELPKAQAKLAQARGQLAAARAAATRAAAEVKIATEAVKIARQGLEEANDELQHNQDVIGSMARSAYMRAGVGEMDLILGAKTAQEFADGQVFVRRAMRQQNDAIHGAAKARARIASETARLEARKQDVKRKQNAADAAVKKVEAFTASAAAAEHAVRMQIAARQSALNAAQRERAAEVATYRRLQAESRRLTALIRKIERQRAAAARRAARAGRRSRNGPADTGGSLLWPTSGPLTSNFGWRMHPIFGYRRLHAGIDIGAPWGQSVHAARGGVVTYAGGMTGYGNIVLVSHGSLTTGYAHLSSINVRAGQSVSRGSTVGRIGSTGNSTGPHLHFETRLNGNPVDPLRYF